MSVKVTDNTVTIQRDTKQKASLAIRFALDGIEQVSTPKTPRKTGDLRNRTNKSVLGLHGAIKWLTGYAVYQETKQFTNYTTPGTGPHFAENAAISEGVRNAEKYFRKAGLL